jgi:hypothetical protein
MRSRSIIRFAFAVIAILWPTATIRGGGPNARQLLEIAVRREANISALARFACKIEMESFRCRDAKFENDKLDISGDKVRRLRAVYEMAYRNGDKGLRLVVNENDLAEIRKVPPKPLPGLPNLRAGVPVPYTNERFLSSEHGSLSYAIPNPEQSIAFVRGSEIPHIHQNIYFGCFGRESCKDAVREIAAAWTAGAKVHTETNVVAGTVTIAADPPNGPNRNLVLAVNKNYSTLYSSRSYATTDSANTDCYSDIRQ